MVSGWWLVAGGWWLVVGGGAACVLADSFGWVFSMTRPVWYVK